MRYLIVSHDAGGAEVVSAWVRANPQNEYSYRLEGPAIEIFKSKLTIPEHEFIPDMVLTGTSGESSLERQAIKQAKVKTICYLDHWVNYESRLDELPDEIWVGDKKAYKIASRLFPVVKLVPNQYFKDMEKEFAEMPFRKPGNNILYVSSGEDMPPYLAARFRPHPSVEISTRSLLEDLWWADKVMGVDSMAMAVALRLGKQVFNQEKE